MKVPEPQLCNGARNAKAIENFLFNMEYYLDNSRIEENSRKVATTAVYLIGGAKLWWRIKYTEIKEGRLQLKMWDTLKAAIWE